MDNGYFVHFGGDEANQVADNFKPEALTLAREFRGLTKAELAKLVNKTPGAISQFESGITNPDAKTLKAIGFTLGFPIRFFCRTLMTKPITIEQCHFRCLRSASQKHRRQVLANGRLFQNLVEQLEEFIELPLERLSDIPQPHNLGNSEIENFAVEVRQRWGLGLGPIPELIQLLEANGVICSFVSEANLDVDAFSFWESGRPYICLTRSKGSTSRVRFDCAHELGHLLMHVDVQPGNKELEAQANRFAGAFLVPREVFLKEYPRRFSLDAYFELKKRWKVSAAALIRRAYDLECMSEATYRRAFIQLNQTGARYNEPFEPPSESLSVISQALTIAEDEMSQSDLSNLLCIRQTDFDNLIHSSLY